MSYVFGSVLLLLLGVQVLTGILLATVYSPSVASAWASVAYLERKVPLGSFIRGLHSASASALLTVSLCHLAQVTLFGAYRRPREVTWFVGLLLFGCLGGFALTGYLLPWDQKGYFATQVATSLVGATPLVGSALRRLLLGGDTYGNLTLTRFYALHTLALPALTLTLTLVHVALMRRHGVTPSFSQSEAERAQRTEPFWPGQATRDLAAMALVLFGVLVVAHFVPASLEAPADPTASYEARPEWYFLPLYQLLKYFPGRFEWVGAMLLPASAGALLALLPILDRGPSSHPLERKRFVGAVFGLLFGLLLLGGLAVHADRSSTSYHAFRARADLEAARALTLSEGGVPVAGGAAVYENDPLIKGRRLFQERCAGCHRLQAEGERRAPDLDGWSSRTWLLGLLQEPQHPRFYGATKIRGMEPVHLPDEDLDALVEWLYSQSGAEPVDAMKAERGRSVFDAHDCADCHESDGTSGGSGVPNLGGRGSTRWLRDFIADPGDPRFFGRKNQMPRFRDKLNNDEIAALTALLAAERDRNAQPTAPSP